MKKNKIKKVKTPTLEEMCDNVFDKFGIEVTTSIVTSLLGVTYDNKSCVMRPVFSEQKAIKALMEENNWDWDCAAEYFDYNIKRAYEYEIRAPIWVEEPDWMLDETFCKPQQPQEEETQPQATQTKGRRKPKPPQ